jgi:hypothetical protein
VPVTRVTSGEALGRLADTSEATLLHSDEFLMPEAKEIAASLFDYLRDVADISDDASFSDKLTYNREMEAMLQKLEQFGASAYSATRSANMTGEFWSEKTLMPVTIGYLAIIPADRDITDLLVPRRLS